MYLTIFFSKPALIIRMKIVDSFLILMKDIFYAKKKDVEFNKKNKRI